MICVPPLELKKYFFPYAIHLVVVGLFTIDKKFPDHEKLLRVTGASMLYSAAREFIITVTSRGPWSEVIIPTVSFLPEEKAKKMAPSPSASDKKK